MTLRLTAEQRCALYEEFVVLMTGVDRLVEALVEKDDEAAGRLSVEFRDLLTFVVSDVGIGSSATAETVVRTDSGIARRAVTRMLESARSWQREEADVVEEASNAFKRSQRRVAAHEEVLRGLEGEA
jgi:hypothetical protein